MMKIKIEKAACDHGFRMDGSVSEETSFLSIAISLKRIADILEASHPTTYDRNGDEDGRALIVNANVRQEQSS